VSLNQGTETPSINVVPHVRAFTRRTLSIIPPTSVEGKRLLSNLISEYGFNSHTQLLVEIFNTHKGLQFPPLTGAQIRTIVYGAGLLAKHKDMRISDNHQREELFLWFVHCAKDLMEVSLQESSQKAISFQMQEISNTVSGLGFLAAASVLREYRRVDNNKNNNNVVDYRFILSLGMRLCELGKSFVNTAVSSEREARNLLLSIKGYLFGLELLIQAKRRDYCSNWNDENWREVRCIVDECDSMLDTFSVAKSTLEKQISSMNNFNVARVLGHCRKQSQIIKSIFLSTKFPDFYSGQHQRFFQRNDNDVGMLSASAVSAARSAQ